jgi:hypothetical protein
VNATVIGFGGAGEVGAALGVTEAEADVLPEAAVDGSADPLEEPPLEQPAITRAATATTASARKRGFWTGTLLILPARRRSGRLL